MSNTDDMRKMIALLEGTAAPQSDTAEATITETTEFGFIKQLSETAEQTADEPRIIGEDAVSEEITDEGIGTAWAGVKGKFSGWKQNRRTQMDVAKSLSQYISRRGENPQKTGAWGETLTSWIKTAYRGIEKDQEAVADLKKLMREPNLWSPKGRGYYLEDKGTLLKKLTTIIHDWQDRTGEAAQAAEDQPNQAQPQQSPSQGSPGQAGNQGSTQQGTTQKLDDIINDPAKRKKFLDAVNDAMADNPDFANAVYKAARAHATS
jgi:hypothetical protein